MNQTLVGLHQNDLQAQLTTHGFCVLPQFLNQSQIIELLEFLKNQHLDYDQTKPNYLFVAAEQSRLISEKIKTQIAPSIKQYFKSGKLLGGVFMIKKPGENKPVHFHQDWSLVDESKFISYNLWCPLTDAERSSGALMVLKKSHAIGMKQRSSTFPPLEIEIEKINSEYIETIHYKAGDALLYNHAMFHGSESNRGASDRIAIACGMIPESASFIYQHWNDAKSAIEHYEVDNDFYIAHIHEVLAGKIPEKYKCVNTVPYDQKPDLKEQDFLTALKKINRKKSKFFFFDFFKN